MSDSTLAADGHGTPANVSRETRERLAVYVDLLGRWNARINLVSASTMADPWQRHIWDSAQLLPDALAVGGRMADLGSGAGLPGLILAIMGRPTVALLESDQRKCAFLREAARATATEVTILQGRMEALPPADATLVTARACAPLDRLLAHAMRHLVAGGTALFLKGRSADEEIAEARKTWTFDVHRRPSTTDPEACVLRLENIARG